MPHQKTQQGVVGGYTLHLIITLCTDEDGPSLDLNPGLKTTSTVGCTTEKDDVFWLEVVRLLDITNQIKLLRFQNLNIKLGFYGEQLARTGIRASRADLIISLLVGGHRPTSYLSSRNYKKKEKQIVLVFLAKKYFPNLHQTLLLLLLQQHAKNCQKCQYKKMGNVFIKLQYNLFLYVQ